MLSLRPFLRAAAAAHTQGVRSIAASPHPSVSSARSCAIPTSQNRSRLWHCGCSSILYRLPYIHLRHASSKHYPRKRSPRRPLPPAPTQREEKTTTHTHRRLRRYLVVASLFILTTSTYCGILYTSLRTQEAASHNPDEQDNDLTTRYDDTAERFDTLVERYEYWGGIARLRKKLVSQARGQVLESCAGTGRNLDFYDFGDAGPGMLGKAGQLSEEKDANTVKSLVCVDRSAAMLDVARQKWNKMHPVAKDGSTDSAAGKIRLLVQPAERPLPGALKDARFDTVVQTMGLCSLPRPTLHLLHLASLTNPTGGTLLLLEHGRSPYAFVNWVLDRSAKQHAEMHGCWYNRDIGGILKECEDAGILVVEYVWRPWWQFGTVWAVKARVGPALGGSNNVGGSLLEK